ncbi:MAG: type II toxin-antitoxin system RelE/ParE family toxin [Magnetococcales bacterium]|nr:type II toxin-antitoxin system RelE/ParE family toxin [Magnetococcales bacterium]
MIKTFADKKSAALFMGHFVKGIPAEIVPRTRRRSIQIHHALCVEDLLLPPSNHLEKLSGNRKGQWSIRINDQWRVCFRFVDRDAFDVEIVDYH